MKFYRLPVNVHKGIRVHTSFISCTFLFIILSSSSSFSSFYNNFFIILSHIVGTINLWRTVQANELYIRRIHLFIFLQFNHTVPVFRKKNFFKTFQTPSILLFPIASGKNLSNQSIIFCKKIYTKFVIIIYREIICPGILFTINKTLLNLNKNK